MSKITAMSYKHNIFTFKLEDGSTFLISAEKPQQKCDWGIIQVRNYSFIDSVLLSFDGAVMRSDSVQKFYNSDARYKRSDTITKLSDGNFELCRSELFFTDSKSSNSSSSHEEVACHTILNSTKLGDWDFYNNHEAYRLDDCTLVVTHNNCTEFWY